MPHFPSNVDGVGGLDAADLQLLREQLVNVTPPSVFCDVDDSGACDVADAYTLSRFLSILGVPILNGCTGYDPP